jgi:hypothetical protein
VCVYKVIVSSKSDIIIILLFYYFIIFASVGSLRDGRSARQKLIREGFV